MPTYSYKCRKCGYEFDITGSYGVLFGYRPSCPSCYSKKVKKELNNPYVIFKGKGFYSNDKKKE